MGQAKIRKKAAENGTLKPQDLFRGTFLLGRDGIWDGGKKETSQLVGYLKRADEAGLSIRDFADMWVVRVIESVGDHISFLESSTAGFDPGKISELAHAREFETSLLSVENHADKSKLALLNDFFQFSFLTERWCIEQGLQTRAGADARRKKMLAEVARLRGLPSEVRLSHLGMAVAEKFGLDFEAARIEKAEELDGDEDESDDDEYIPLPLSRGEFVEVLKDFAAAAGEWKQILNTDTSAMERDRLIAYRRRRLELESEYEDALSILAHCIAVHGFEKATEPDAEFCKGEVALVILECADELRSLVIDLLNDWSGGNVHDIHDLLKIILGLRQSQGGPKGSEKRLTIGEKSVWRNVLSTNPELIFQDIDGNVIYQDDRSLVVVEYDGQAESEEQWLAMERNRISFWDKTLKEASPSIEAFVLQNGGPERWMGSEQKLCSLADPKFGRLVNESDGFGVYVLNHLAYKFMEDRSR